MDNVTHSLVGLAAARAGLERVSAYATPVAIIAANAPDADIAVLLFGDSWDYLHHHRGITHSIIGTLLCAVIIPTLFWAVDLLVARVRKQTPRAKFRNLLFVSLLLSLSHPLLDWTNNYGVRPLLPFDRRWFYGDLVFIVDPFLWLLLGGACFLLSSKTRSSIFAPLLRRTIYQQPDDAERFARRLRIAVWILVALLIAAVIIWLPGFGGYEFATGSRLIWLAGLMIVFVMFRARLAERWNGAIASVALIFVITYWGGLALAHSRAVMSAEKFANALATTQRRDGAQRTDRVRRVATMPTLANPLKWRAIVETEQSFYRFDVTLTDDEYEVATGDELTGMPRNFVSFEKPRERERGYVEAAERDRRARIFLDFARFPAARVSGNCADEMLVQWADLRFTEPGRSARGNFALEVEVPRAP